MVALDCSGLGRRFVVWCGLFHQGHGDFKDLSVGIVSDVVPRYDTTSRLGLACAQNGRSGINCTDLSKATIARENRFTISFHAFLLGRRSYVAFA